MLCRTRESMRVKTLDRFTALNLYNYYHFYYNLKEKAEPLKKNNLECPPPQTWESSHLEVPAPTTKFPLTWVLPLVPWTSWRCCQVNPQFHHDFPRWPLTSALNCTKNNIQFLSGQHLGPPAWAPNPSCQSHLPWYCHWGYQARAWPQFLPTLRFSHASP